MSRLRRTAVEKDSPTPRVSLEKSKPRPGPVGTRHAHAPAQLFYRRDTVSRAADSSGQIERLWTVGATSDTYNIFVFQAFRLSEKRWCPFGTGPHRGDREGAHGLDDGRQLRTPVVAAAREQEGSGSE